MAEKKVENKDLFAGDLIGKTVDDVRVLIKELDVLEAKIVDVAKVQKKVLENEDNKTLQSVTKTKDAVDILNKSEQINLEIQKQKGKLETKLKSARTDAIQDNEELKILLSEQNKINKQIAKESLGLVSAYDKQSKKLNQLRKEYKDLALTEGKATKETKDLLRQINKLDKELKEIDASAGQFQRNVGNYPKTLGSATKSLVGFAAALLGAKGGLDGIKTSIDSNVEGSENYREITSKLGGVFDQVKNVVSGAALDLFDYGAAVIENVNSGKGFIDSLKGQEENFTRTSVATTDFTDKVKESANAQEELTKRIIAFEKSSRPLEVRITQLNGLIEQQGIIAGDSTRSFNEINTAILKGQNLQVERAGIVMKLAKEELDITKERIRIANLSGGAGVELLNEETEAINKVKDAENGLKNEILENEKEIRQVKQDRLEIDLDILIDGFDNQKTINERIIANEKETLEKRSSLLERTNKLAEDSFRGQKDVLQQLSAAGINVDDLLLLDATELAKQIQLLEQSEIVNTRTLEVIRERRIVLQDLKDAQEDLNEAEQEGLDLSKEIQAQEEALFNIITSQGQATTDEIDKLDKQRTLNQIDSLERRLEVVKEGSLEELRLRKELNDLLLSEQDRINQERLKKEEEILKNQQELTEAAITVVQDLVEKGFQKRIEALDKQISKTSERADQLREKASEGRLAAEDSLAFEQKKEAELEKQREQERKRQQQAQAFFTVLSTFQANVNNNDPTPLQSTIRDVAVLRQLASSLTGFYEGTDDVGKSLGKGQLPGKDGHIIRVDKSEQIWSGKDRSDVNFRTRDEIKDIVKKYDSGMFEDMMKFDKSQQFMNPSAFALNGFSDKRMVSELSEIKKGIKGIDIPKGMVDIDQVRGIITLITRKGNTVVKEKSKLFN